MQSLSIRTKIIIALYAVVLFSLGFSGYVNYHSTRRALTEAANEFLYFAASQTATRIDHFIQANLDTIATESRLESLANYLRQRAAGGQSDDLDQRLLGVLNTFRQRDDVFISSYALLDMQGHNVLDTHRPNIGRNESDRNYFHTPLGIAFGRRPYASSVEFDHDGDASLYFSSRVVDREENVVGVLRARFRANVLQHLVIQDIGLAGSKSFPMILDENHVRLAYGLMSGTTANRVIYKAIVPFKEEKIVELQRLKRLPLAPSDRLSTAITTFETGLNSAMGQAKPYFTTRLATTGDRLMAGAVAKMKAQPWLVVFVKPQDISLAPVTLQSRNLLLLTLVIGLFVLGLAVLLAHILARPIKHLTDAAMKVADGDLAVQIGISSRDEIGTLAVAFNSMTTRLSQLIGNLEKEITERKHAEEALAESKEFLDKIINTLGEPVYVKDRQHCWILLNNALCQFMGYSHSEIIGKTDYDLFTKKEAQRHWEHDEVVFTSGQEKINEEQFTGNDGTVHTIIMKKALYTDEKGQQFIVGIINDITERKALEEQLRQAVKMDALGKLSGGIAHDFNNLLQVISGYIQLLLLKKTNDNPDYKYLTEMNRTTVKASSMVQRLLTFSRKMKVDFQRISINDVIQSTIHLLHHTIPKMVAIKTRLQPDLAEIQADPLQMEQMLMNLASNAVDAMEGSGTLTIETETFVAEAGITDKYLELAAGEYVLIKISDTGTGMDEETRQRIFDPFFTTKEIGKGTGLGLATVYGTVRSHKGHVQCYSQPGQGSTFKVYLPVAHVDDGVREVNEQSQVELRGGTETILLVDDESLILGIAEELLSEYGYSILRAGSGEEALSTYSTNKDSIDLLIMDLGMPGIGGEEALKELLKIDPDVKVIVASGYSAHRIARDPTSYGAAGFLSKPYRLDEMLHTVRSVFD